MRPQILLRSPTTLFFPQKQVFKGSNSSYPEAMATDLKNNLLKRQRNLRICLCMSTLLILVAVFMVLVFAIFKPKNPTVLVNPVDLEHFQVLSPNSNSSPLGLVITIQNPNYASFMQGKTCSGYLKYGDTIIAEVPFAPRSYPARRTTTITTTANIQTHKLIEDPNFWSAMEGGVFNMTAEGKLSGKVSMVNIIRLKAKVFLSCTISFNVSAVHATSTCISKIKL